MNNQYDRGEEAPNTLCEVDITEASPAVKLVMFINGEEVICELTESFDGTTYKLNKPLRVMVQATSSDGNERTSTIAFSDWMPLSEDRTITVNRSFIATITNPIESLITSYRNG